MHNGNTHTVITVAAVKSMATLVRGKVGDQAVELMLDSGSSVSLIQSDALEGASNVVQVTSARPIQLITASGDRLPILQHVRAPVQLGELCVIHEFVVVKTLVAPVILGVDFLQKHGLTLDFTQTPVSVSSSLPNIDRAEGSMAIAQVMPIYEATKCNVAEICAISVDQETEADVVDDCAVPNYNVPPSFELPACALNGLQCLLEKYRDLFCIKPGYTEHACHFIPTSGNPVKVPPRRIPAHYRDEVYKQLQTMLDEGIIKRSKSPWMAPAVFVPKKSGQIRICIDYRELNKRTTKDSYPLPLPDEVQDKLAGSKIFSTLDLHSGYWQLPVNPKDQEKTAFCPGPGMGLFEFCRMPFGLSGAPSSFQRLMDTILQGLPFVTIYLDDILVHSTSETEHKEHLDIVFKTLLDAGLTLRGAKCHIGMSAVHYLGHVFSGEGMSPDPSKVQVVVDWPTPNNPTEVRQFLGLASYYRRYIPQFANIASPLYSLTQTGVTFIWSDDCVSAFTVLKQYLINAPVLAYPCLASNASEFALQTDASAVGLGAVLEQEGHPIAYASRSLTSSERNYSVIQRECLAIVFALKQFRHYLLGRPFKLYTDHAPLQWLSAQKMEGMLCRWSLAIQEYDFAIVYRKGSANSNADALSRRTIAPCAVTISLSYYSHKDLQDSQSKDTTLSTVLQARLASTDSPKSTQWNRPPFYRYKQLWHQLKVVDGILCRQYSPGPMQQMVTVPFLPPDLRRDALKRNHDAPTAGHMGTEKTLDRLRRDAFWVNMARDVEEYCRQCPTCQHSKLPMPQRAPLQNIPIGQPWQMVAVDILQVPLSVHNNRYLLVIQDYFTKWVDAIPLPDQTASRISAELIKFFSTYGPPQILHSDQGRNFESTMLSQVLHAFGVRKSRTTSYHPQGDGMVERFNRTLLQLLRSYVSSQSDWETYLPYVLYAYRTSQHTTTGVSPFLLLYGRNPTPYPMVAQLGYDQQSYPAQIQAKIAELQDFVHINLSKAACSQKLQYDQHTTQPAFIVGSPVWLSIPTAGKLDPRWEGDWVIKSMKSPITAEICDGKRTRVVHTNRLQHRYLPGQHDCAEPSNADNTHKHPDWAPPSVDHFVLSPPEQSATRYPQRSRRPPDWYRP